MSYSNEEVIERFAPQLDENHARLFHELTDRIMRAYPHYRSQVLREELNRLNTDMSSISDVKYEVVLRTILDLLQQGWEPLIKENELYLMLPENELWVPKRYACKDTAQAENDRLRGRRDDDNSRIQRVKLFFLLLSQSVFTPCYGCRCH